MKTFHLNAWYYWWDDLWRKYLRIPVVSGTKLCRFQIKNHHRRSNVSSKMTLTFSPTLSRPKVVSPEREKSRLSGRFPLQVFEDFQSCGLKPDGGSIKFGGCGCNKVWRSFISHFCNGTNSMKLEMSDFYKFSWKITFCNLKIGFYLKMLHFCIWIGCLHLKFAFCESSKSLNDSPFKMLRSLFAK
jgi:hypothetical protein